MYPVPYATVGDFIGVFDGEDYVPEFFAGVNLGVGVPGTHPGELAPSADQYRRWFQQMEDAGIDSIRVYTLHYPRFYEELLDHNLMALEPIYVFQGVWLDEENPALDLDTLTLDFDAAIEETVDAIHGSAQIDHRYGRAYGEFTADISQWVAGWMIGREISPFEVLGTNESHPDWTSFEGEAFAVREGEPAEVWSVARMDHLVTYERDMYEVQRPVSMSSWPTLDPMRHPTEGWLRDEDIAQLDFNVIEIIDAPAGWYATYHAYPYYPDFISEDPDYRTFVDDQGPNNYLGYLFDLKDHYADVPLIAGEFGTPSSWGNAHYSFSGMNHGGMDEAEQADQAIRMLGNIHEAGLGGGMYFAWMDEWWKRTWITDNLDFPWERRRLWHNITAPEQNFGLVGFDLAEPDFTRFEAVYGDDEVRSIQLAVDAAFVHVLVTLSEPLDGPIEIGFDTYSDDLGERQLISGQTTERRLEFLIEVSPDAAQLYVSEAYDTYGIWHGLQSEAQLFQSVASDTGEWSPVRWLNNDAHSSDDGQFVFEATVHEIGQLRVAGPTPSSLDAVFIDGNTVRIRLPWTLLQVSDPSAVSVLHDDSATAERDAIETAGLAVIAAMNGVVVEGARHAWDPWEVAPSTTERDKPGLALYGETAGSLYAPESR